MRVWLLGVFRVSVGSRIIGEDRWRRRKAAALVKLLSLAPGHRLHRRRMMDLLWPELDVKAATNNLHHVLHHARRTLEPASEPAGASRYLLLRGEQLALCPDAPLWVDVEAFGEASAGARRAREPAAYRAATELYAGELLPEDRYEGWTAGTREQLRRTYLELLVELAALHEERAKYEPAIEALRTVVAQEPLQEEAHAGLMRLYALAGRPREALRQYERLEKVLSGGSGREPHRASRLLRDEIAAGRLRLSPARSGGSAPEENPRSLDRHNLPATRTSFVNRVREMLELKRELAMTRLLTLAGAGGTGKTRLAQEVSKDLVGAYPDGVWLVQLASLREPKLVEQVVAGTLGVRERAGRALSATLAEELQAKNLLLVVDNCEHLIEAVASLTDELLDACPKVRILATSREPLHVAGEVVWRLAPLPVPEPTDPALLGKEGLERFAVTRLFLDRAHRRKDDSLVSGRGLQAVASVCRRLEGIPLAIELAAARTAALSVEQIDERLGDSLGLLTTGFRSAPQRHRTLRATLDWSYDLLSEGERVLFRRLSAFAGGFRLGAAEALESGEGVGEDDALDLLSQLVEKSLVALEESEHDGALRYTMLEPVRQYAREKLRESGEENAVQRRHARFYLVLAEEAEPQMSGPDQETWLRRLEREHANLRGALAWALDPSDRGKSREHRTELALRLAGALGRFWAVYSPGEGRRWLERGLAAKDRAAPKPALAKALYEAGWIELFQGDYKRAINLLEEALTLFRELGDRTLNWTASTDVDSNSLTYELQHKQTNGTYATVQGAGNLDSASYSFGGSNPAEDEGTWTYRVKASDGNLSSDFSADSSGIKVDRSKPNPPLADERTPDYTASNGDKWYKDSATVNFTENGDPVLADGSDGSGVGSVSDPVSRNTSGVLGYSGRATDKAGNESEATSGSVNVDADAPTSSASAKDSDNNDYNSGNWTNKNVTVTLSADDGQGSGVKHIAYSVNGGQPENAASSSKQITVSDEGTTTITFHAVDNVGKDETQEHTFTVKLDKTAPDFSCEQPNEDWHADNVTLNCTATDDGSGLTNSSPNSFFLSTNVSDGNETANASTDNQDLSDLAGNSVTAGPITDIKVDRKAPTFACDTDDGSWHATNQSFNCPANDGGSGLTPTSDANFSLSTTVDADNETSNASTGTKDLADAVGNTVTTPAITGVKVDRKAPVLTNEGPTPTNPNGANNWYTSAVTNKFTATDGGSGFAPNGDLTKSITNSSGTDEGNAVKIASGAVSDAVGNSAASIDSAAFKIDLSDPTNVTFRGGPAADSSYDFGDTPAKPTCTADDAVSGFASCDVIGYSTALGTHTTTATAKDNAGRTTTATRTYTVKAWTFKGFYQSVDMNGTLNTVQGGSTVPIKFELFKGTTELTDTANVKQPLQAQKVNCTSVTGVEDPIELTATGGTSLRYDSTGGQYIYNWKTPTGAGSCYKVTITALDGSSQTALFKLK